MARGEAITKTGPCTYERVLKLMSPCHGVVKGKDVTLSLCRPQVRHTLCISANSVGGREANHIASNLGTRHIDIARYDACVRSIRVVSDN